MVSKGRSIERIIPEISAACKTQMTAYKVMPRDSANSHCTISLQCWTFLIHFYILKLSAKYNSEIVFNSNVNEVLTFSVFVSDNVALCLHYVKTLVKLLNTVL